jgi:putative ABC transport system permease protein
MVRWESVIVATFGTVGGIGIGLFVGWGLVRALNASEGFGSFVVPAGQLVVIVVLGAAVGIIAGLRPAWRAARLDVLDAVSAD